MHYFLSICWQKADCLKDKLFRNGCDFSLWVIPTEIQNDASRGNKYQPSTDSLKKVLKKMNINSNDSIIDIGCGKGKALYIMSKFPFSKISGFDLSSNLVTVAKKNMQKLSLDNIDVFKADASTFEDYDEYNYFYIFNSVPEKVFLKTIINIKKSIKKKPRKCIFIYLNPVYHDLLIENNFREIYNYKSIIKWFEYRCYEIV